MTNWHVNKPVLGFDGAHCGFGADQRHLEGSMLLEVCMTKELCMSDTSLNWEKEKMVVLRQWGRDRNVHCVSKKKVIV